jgi:uncharacterized membrane protein YfcA
MHWTSGVSEVILSFSSLVWSVRTETRSHALNNLSMLLAMGVVAGAMNALGGGGSFIALPALIALGVPAIEANASTTLALLPGGWVSAWSYRDDLQRFEIAPIVPMLTASAFGGLLGAMLLLATPTRAFDAVLPWLVLFASLTFALGRPTSTRLRVLLARGRFDGALSFGIGSVLVIQFILALYAGYFGGGVGIVMMSAWNLVATFETQCAGRSARVRAREKQGEASNDLPAMQAARMVMVTTANAMAAAWFALSGAVAWRETATISAAGIVGGYAGARVSLRLRPGHVRGAIVVIGLLLSVGLFARR